MKNPLKRSLAVFLILGPVLAGNHARADVATLSLQSQAGDFIGQGQTVNNVYTTGISAQILSGLNVAGQPAFLRFSMGVVTGSNATNTFTTLDFATNQLNLPFQTGTYLNAQRASFATAGHAGLDVSFQNRGSNTLTGQFTVNSVAFYTDSFNVRQIGSLDVNFEQHSEGAAPALFGHFTYTSSALAVPEPSVLTLAGLGGVVLAVARLRRVGPKRSV